MPSATMSSDTGTVPTRVTSSRFIGRSRELAELEAALADASAGRPSLAFIAGESGVGKTRLLKELERGALAAEARVVSGECVSLGEDELPYAPIVAALRSLTRDGDPVLDELGPATRAGLASLLPELAPATALPVMDRDAPAQSRVFEALLTLLDLLGRDEPVRAGDRGPSLGRRLHARLPLLPGAQPALRARAARRVLPPRRAAPPPPAAPAAGRARARAARAAHRARCRSRRSELAEQLEDILGAAPDDARVARMYARSEGNPLFTEELLAAGLDGRGELPPTLRDALMVRIEALPQDAQEVLRVLSAGRSLDHALLAEASGLESGALREALREAAAGHVIDGRRGGQLRLPPRAAARGRPRRPAARRARRAAPRAGARVRAPHAGAGRQRAGSRRASPTTTCPPATSRRRSPPPCARPTRPRRSMPTARRRRLYERALQLWSRVPDPEALAGIDHATLLCRGRRRAPRQAPRRGALRGGAERDRRDGRALPRRRPARAPRQRALGAGRRRAQPDHARARPGAAARRRRLQRRARAAARPAGEVPHAARAPSQRRRGGPRRADAAEAAARAGGAQPRAQCDGHLAHGPRRGRPAARASCARRSTWRSTHTVPARDARGLHQPRRPPAPARALGGGPRRRPRGRRAHRRHRRLQLVGEHGRGRDRAGHRRLGLSPSATCPTPGR